MLPEFHRPLPVDRISASGFAQHIEATKAERVALAQRLEIPGLATLVCDFRLRREGQGVVAADARLQARVTRVCVVSLDEFEADIALEFRVRFVPAALESEELDLEAEDEISYDGERIDLGEAAAQELALALDPYPRKPDAELPADAAEPAPSPFAVLGSRRRVS
jgi:uncharacterized metal-binding protein YceD (DUF177 family)